MTKIFEKKPFFVVNPDTLWSRNYYEEMKSLEEIYFERSQKRFNQINNLNAQIGPIYVIHPDDKSLNLSLIHI